jgi:hypothetical protein
MSLISAGQGLRRTANLAQSKVASADVAGEKMRLQSEMAEDAQQRATIGTAGGIGGMVGANRYFALKDAAAAAAEAAGTTAAGTTAAGTAAAAGTTAAGTTAAGTTAAAGTAATGTMATLGAIAAPVAIALGIGYLFSEIF